MNIETVLAAGITGLFAFLVGKSTSKGEYVTKQRESWRDYLRKWIEEMTILLSEYKACSKFDDSQQKRLKREIDSKINSIIVRLNPVRDDKLINYLLCPCKDVCCKEANKERNCSNKMCTKPIGQGKYYIDMDIITFYISKLLKSDWERVKTNTSMFGETLFLNLLFITFSAIVGYLALSQIGEEFSFDILAMFLYVLFPYLLVKISYSLLMVNEKARMKNYQNIFSSKKTPYFGVENLRKNKKIEYVLTVSYLLFTFCGIGSWIIIDLLILWELIANGSMIIPLLVVIIILASAITFILIKYKKVFKLKDIDCETSYCLSQDIGYGLQYFYN